MPRPAIGYVRVSTEVQAREGVSLDVQRDRIAHYAASRDLQLDPIILADEGLSGRRADNRPALQQALTLACERKAVLVVYSLSRFARSTRECLTMIERLAKAGADVASLSEAIDTSSAHGKFFLTLVSALAQLESDQTSERVRAAIAHKKARGEYIGALPYGWQLAADGVRLEPCAAEQDMIEDLVEWRLSGMSYPMITVVAQAAGVTNRLGRPIAMQQIHKIVRRRGAELGVDLRLSREAFQLARSGRRAKWREVRAHDRALTREQNG